MVLLETFTDTEKTIAAKVSQFSLPNFLRQELRDLIPLLRELLSDWINYHDKCALDLPQDDYSAVDLIHIMWTKRGRIDYLQTAIIFLAIGLLT